MSTGHRKNADPAISTKEIDEAISALLKKVDVDNQHWIPYLGGYAKDWTKHREVYLNATFKDSMQVGGKTMHPYRYILIHECV